MKRDGFRTEQEEFWAGQFGDQYVDRNRHATLHASNLAFFSRALRNAGSIGSCLEVGANIGMNLSALTLLYPGQKQFAVEINHKAAQELRARLPEATVFEGSVLDLDLPAVLERHGCDLVLTKGALIHINPDFLVDVYRKLHAATSRYLLICEYYSPAPTSITYRGHSDRLYKRDFAGELLDQFPSLELIDYGFSYRRDRSFPQDDISWFLMQRTSEDRRQSAG